MHIGVKRETLVCYTGGKTLVESIKENRDKDF